MIAHHCQQDLLTDYATGATGEAVSLVVAAHLALCPACRRQVQEWERVAGSLLENLHPVPMNETALTNAMSRLGEMEAPALVQSGAGRSSVPEPLRSYIGDDLARVRWIAAAPGLSYRPVLKRNGIAARLLRSKPGRGVALHTHGGAEYSLVLAGGYTDSTGHYFPGDLQTATPEVRHELIADPGEDCIVLAVADAPLRFRNPLAGLIAKWVGY